MLHKASKTALIHLLFFIFLSKNVLFQTLCANIENEYSDDNYDDEFENITENYDDLEDYNDEYNIEGPEADNDYQIDNNNNNSFPGFPQEADLKIFVTKLKQELLLDQKSNFPNSNNNITFPPNKYETDRPIWTITQLNNSNDGTGNFYTSFGTGSYGGVKLGELKKGKLQVIKGRYTEKFKQDLPAGLPPIDVIRNVGYIADEKGFQPFIINYTVEDHSSDTEEHFDVPFYEAKRLSEEYKTHYKPQEQFSNAKLPNITDNSLIKDDLGNYNFSIDTQLYKRAESSEIINHNTENERRIVKGQYSNFIGNGPYLVRQTIGYIADQNGFQPFVIDSPSNNQKSFLDSSTQSNSYDSKRLAEDVSIHFKPLDEYKNVKLPTLDNQDQNKSSDGYQFNFSSDTYNRSEISEIKNKGTENEILVIKGQYTEQIKNEFGENVVRQIGYVADEHGYQPFIIKSYIKNRRGGMGAGPAGQSGGGGSSPPAVGSSRGQSIASSYIAMNFGQLG